MKSSEEKSASMNESASKSRGMNILIIQPWLSYRGAENVSVSLARGLVRLGHSASIVTVYVDRKRPPLGIDDVSVTTAHPLLASLCQFHPLLYLIFAPPLLLLQVWNSSKRADILNPHNPPALLIAAIVGRVRKIPVISSCHGLPISKRWTRRASLLDYFAWRLAASPFERWAIRSAKSIVANSKKTAIEIRSNYGKEALVIYPPLIDEPWRQPLDSQKSVVSLRIIVVGRLDSRKNQLAAIDAFAKVREIMRGGELVFAGDGPMERELKDYAAELGISKYVKFLGYIEPERLRELYRSSRVALMPAFDEPWGLTPFEALSAGCVPVVSSQSGAAEVISRERIGAICSPVSIDIANTLVAVLSDYESSKLFIERGRRFLRNSLTENEYSERYAMEFSDTLSESSSYQNSKMIDERGFASQRRRPIPGKWQSQKPDIVRPNENAVSDPSGASNPSSNEQLRNEAVSALEIGGNKA